MLKEKTEIHQTSICLKLTFLLSEHLKQSMQKPALMLY